jgi:hypothetical protein
MSGRHLPGRLERTRAFGSSRNFADAEFAAVDPQLTGIAYQLPLGATGKNAPFELDHTVVSRLFL